ncbi:hypothetical protein, partial [Virgisporangium aurantiacum]|uniref:hypothetical protein n=1 Tax=Virgisporangium aurantiacum TaxID=175570 RepID=UPI001950A13C
DRNDNRTPATRTPATYRTTRPATYRTTNPVTAAAGPSVHSVVGRYDPPPHVVAPNPATPGPAPQHVIPPPQDIDDCAAAPDDRRSAGMRRTVRAHYVDSDCLIGLRHPHRPDLLQARGVDTGGHPRVMLPVLRRLWTAAGRDSTRLAARLLAHDWRYLDPAIPTTVPTSATTAEPAAEPAAASWHGDHGNGRNLQGVTGRRVIAGVGVTHTAIGPDAAIDSEPAMVVPLAHFGLLDAAWLYLLDPASDSVTVHIGDGGLVSHHLLDV